MIPRLLCQLPLEGGLCLLSAEQSHYLTKVLRLTPGAAVQVFDGAGQRFEAVISALEGKLVKLKASAGVTQALPRKELIWVAQGLPQGDKLDWVIEKSVEIGTERLIPMSCDRSTVNLVGPRLSKKQAHWKAQIEAACMQSQRDRLMALDDLKPSQLWFTQVAAQRGIKLLLEPSAKEGLFEALKRLMPKGELSSGDSGFSNTPFILAIGPESGFSPKELMAAENAGFTKVHLGKQVLRTETAALVACAKLQAWLDLT